MNTSTYKRSIRQFVVPVGFVCSLVLALALGASQARAATYLGCPGAIAYQAPNNELFLTEPPAYSTGKYVQYQPHAGMEGNTSPSIGGNTSDNCAVTSRSAAFQAYGGSGLWRTTFPTVAIKLYLGMAPGTSPSIVEETTGKFEIAFQASGGGGLWESDSEGHGKSLELGMEPGTSPSIAANGVIAFHANTGALWIYTPGKGGSSNGLGMWPGSSPSITALAGGGWEVAFRASGSGHLWTYSSSGGSVDTGFGVAESTSPSITAFSPYLVAFTASGTHHLWKYTPSGGGVDLGAVVAEGSSPSVAFRNTGYWEAVYRGSNGNLWSYSSVGLFLSPGYAIKSGTSPSIAP